MHSEVAKAVGLSIGISLSDIVAMVSPGLQVDKTAEFISSMLKNNFSLSSAVLEQVKELFFTSLRNARIAGKLIGIALALGFPFNK
jgi:hypothetical protein